MNQMSASYRYNSPELTRDNSICKCKVNNYLLSLLREVKGGKISDIQNNTNKSKRVLVTDITVPSLRGKVISVTSMSLDKFVLFSMSEILPPLTSLKRLSKQL